MPAETVLQSLVEHVDEHNNSNSHEKKMLRKRVHAPQLAGELTLSPALYAVGMMKPMDEPSAKRVKPDASESRYRSQLYGAASELASRRNAKTATRQEVCVECDTCPVTTPLSSLGLAKAPTQWRWRCNDCVVGWNHLKRPYVPPMLPQGDEPEE